MTELKVNGMTCGHCRNTVENSLQNIPGVKSVEVDLASGSVKVEGNADMQQLLTAIEEAGFQAAPAGT